MTVTSNNKANNNSEHIKTNNFKGPQDFFQ